VHFPVGERGLVLVSFGTKALVDFGSAHIVTYEAFFEFLNLFL